jgi:catechol-2,3-dioxygenase
MSRVQLALNVQNLQESIEFYSKMFGTQPAKVREGYANFAISEPPLKLVLIETKADGSSEYQHLNHLGVELESAQLVEEAIDQFSDLGLVEKIEKKRNVLLCSSGQSLDDKPRWCSLGVLHGAC